MGMVFEQVYKGRADSFSRELLSDGAALNLLGVTRMTLSFGGTPEVVVDSATSATAFDWITAGAAGIVEFCLGGEDIDTGEYLAVLTVYAPEYPTGLSGWGRIPIRISDPAGEEV